MLVGYGPSEAPPSRRRRNGSRHREQARPRAAATDRTGPTAGRAAGALHGPAERGRPGGRDRPRARRHHHPRGPGRPPRRRSAGGRTGESGRETRAPVRGVQKHMAEAMVRSVATAPQACVFLTVDATPTVRAGRAAARRTGASRGCA